MSLEMMLRSQKKFPQLDYKAWGYALRAACASCLALFISFSLNLDESHWAFTTCYIVGGQRLQGKILARSLARISGTLVGAIASFVLVNAFAQHGVLFITCFAVWLSLCAFLSYSRRDDWAYAWVLSGYTTAIVGIPAALDPESAFEIIASRGENILIGILCMGGVGMIASPELVGDHVTKLVRPMDEDLSDLLTRIGNYA
ncbi:MAG: FUSC family protein [Verrucomicrobia bacterium]|nr:FUSC family protein [Verrucomicrobiota bacterium]